MQAASTQVAGFAKEQECEKRRQAGRAVPMGFARAAAANRESASVSHDCGGEGRFFIGVQFWRVTVRALVLGPCFTILGPVCNSAYEIESEP
ncbi:hypothetical protein B0G74_8233 [Paraburkholderia sp. BL9I2N2]|nr:hypothetical protein B0G74_8233 [Paraburkholderia sp. BL9I2N2]